MSQRRTTSADPDMYDRERVEKALLRSRSLGFLGPGPVGSHVDHATDMARAVCRHFEPAPGTQVLDLGAGGGLPGLVLAALWPEARFVFLDSNHRRTGALVETVAELGWSDRVTVICERAEVAGRDPLLREAIALVVARSFGPPAVTAECAAPLLRIGGLLAVAEPPAARPVRSVAVGVDDGSDVEETRDISRWPPEGLGLLGLEPVELVAEPVAVQILRQVSTCPERYPRRTGVPSHRPLF